MSDAFVSIHDFRKKLEEYLLYADQPVVITRRQMPVGFFIPAKLWYGRGDEEKFRKLVSVTLDAAGVSEEEVDESIDKLVRSSAENIKKRIEHL
jgi:prevent-host-death family protein